MRSALITGLAGTILTDGERAFLKDVRPAGIILFSRNCESHTQIRCLTASVREAVGTDELLILIDQEGGRVQRLRPPLGRLLPPGAAYAEIYVRDSQRACRSAFLAARLLADDLKALGINTNCAPVLDVPVPGAHDVIGDRAYGTDPVQVATLGRAVAEGLLAGGVLPVIKHIPGHGRATADSHLELPVVDTDRRTLSATDFVPFRLLADMPAAMTAHVVFSDVDAGAPASTSLTVTREVIRGEIGFQGLLMSDDLSMKALRAPIRESAAAVIRAGSDIALHCNGDLAEMEAAAGGVPVLSGPALERFSAALKGLGNLRPYEAAEAEAALAAVLQGHTSAPESV